MASSHQKPANSASLPHRAGGPTTTEAHNIRLLDDVSSPAASPLAQRKLASALGEESAYLPGRVSASPPEQKLASPPGRGTAYLLDSDYCAPSSLLVPRAASPLAGAPSAMNAAPAPHVQACISPQESVPTSVSPGGGRLQAYAASPSPETLRTSANAAKVPDDRDNLGGFGGGSEEVMRGGFNATSVGIEGRGGGGKTVGKEDRRGAGKEVMSGEWGVEKTERPQNDGGGDEVMVGVKAGSVGGAIAVWLQGGGSKSHNRAAPTTSSPTSPAASGTLSAHHPAAVKGTQPPDSATAAGGSGRAVFVAENPPSKAHPPPRSSFLLPEPPSEEVMGAIRDLVSGGAGVAYFGQSGGGEVRAGEGGARGRFGEGRSSSSPGGKPSSSSSSLMSRALGNFDVGSRPLIAPRPRSASPTITWGKGMTRGGGWVEDMSDSSEEGARGGDGAQRERIGRLSRAGSESSTDITFGMDDLAREWGVELREVSREAGGELNVVGEQSGKHNQHQHQHQQEHQHQHQHQRQHQHQHQQEHQRQHHDRQGQQRQRQQGDEKLREKWEANNGTEGEGEDVEGWGQVTAASSQLADLLSKHHAATHAPRLGSGLGGFHCAASDSSYAPSYAPSSSSFDASVDRALDEWITGGLPPPLPREPLRLHQMPRPLTCPRTLNAVPRPENLDPKFAPNPEP